jgi:hypothetical protein
MVANKEQRNTNISHVTERRHQVVEHRCFLFGRSGVHISAAKEIILDADFRVCLPSLHADYGMVGLLRIWVGPKLSTPFHIHY